MMDLESLGFTKEELQQRVVDKICEELLDRETGQFLYELNEHVQKRVDETISAIAEKHVLPNVTAYIENLTLQETNKWGEKVKQPITFIEYLTARAEAYLNEQVDYDGRGKNERDNYSWRASQTRIAHLVHQHLHYSIETAMKSAVQTANNAIANGIQETVKIKLAEITKTLSVNVKTK